MNVMGRGWRWRAGGVMGLFGMLGMAAYGEVRLPRVISAHGVLQRDRPIHIWGWTEAGACVRVEFARQQKEGCADGLGQWSVFLEPERAGGPYTLEVAEKGGSGAPVKVEDLLVGDVWFASGQSNMEMPLKGFGPTTPVKDGEREIAGATAPRIRLLREEHTASSFPVEEATAGWTECTPETAKDFSAVAYFFGREIAQRKGVPIGLIDSSWGGTPIESWISLGAIGRDAGLAGVWQSRDLFAGRFATRAAEMARRDREVAAAKAAGRPEPKFGYLPAEDGAWNPGELYYGMVAPFVPYTVRGFLWYQGETNSDPERAPLYAREMRALIGDWRKAWGEGDLPFLYVQISNYRSPGENWGAVRDAQRRALDVRGTAMAVTLDVGSVENVHPPDKQTVGHRLALGARAESYGERVEWSGPLPEAAYREGGAARVWFEHADGLHATAGAVKGFTLAGADGVFHAATARLAGQGVVVESAEVPEPAVVRYGWAGETDADLANGDGLPASTFEERLVGGR